MSAQEEGCPVHRKDTGYNYLQFYFLGLAITEEKHRPQICESFFLSFLPIKVFACKREVMVHEARKKIDMKDNQRKKAKRG